jgi:hypothetical protein
MANSAISLHGPIGVQDNRNELINGDFNIWQRGITISIQEDVNGFGLVGISNGAGNEAHWGYNTFVADRWKMHVNANSEGVTAPAMTISRNKMPLGYPNGADSSSKWYLNIWVGQTAGEESSANPSTTAMHGMGGFTGPGYTMDGSFVALVQDIDDVNTLEGKTCTLSFWAKSDIANQRVAPVLKQCFAGGTASTLLIQGSTGHLGHTLDNTWRQYKTSFNVPSIQGQPLTNFGSSGDDALQLQLLLQANSGKAGTGVTFELGGLRTAAGQSKGLTGNISFSQVQLEQGSSSTEFDKENPVTEMGLCQHYFWRDDDIIFYRDASLPANFQSIPGANPLVFPVPMRKTPVWDNTVSGPTLSPGKSRFQYVFMRQTPSTIDPDLFIYGMQDYGANDTTDPASFGNTKTSMYARCTNAVQEDTNDDYQATGIVVDAELSVDTD